jgi:hypothetical protein
MPVDHDNRAHRYEYDERGLLVDTTASLAAVPEYSGVKTASLMLLSVADTTLTLTAMVKRPEFVATIQGVEDLIRGLTGAELPPAETVADALTLVGGASSLLLVVIGISEFKKGQENDRRAREAGRI